MRSTGKYIFHGRVQLVQESFQEEQKDSEGSFRKVWIFPVKVVDSNDAIDKDNNPYLESHHIIWLSKGGDDSIENTVALCPNCHRKMHEIANEEDVKLLHEKNKEME